MKKVLALSAVIAMIAVACHKKANPTSATPPPPPVAMMDSSKTAMVAADPAMLEAGRTVYTTKCTKCHPAKPVDNYTTDRWVGILHEMVPKAKLDETETAQVTAYVNANAKK